MQLQVLASTSRNTNNSTEVVVTAESDQHESSSSRENEVATSNVPVEETDVVINQDTVLAEEVRHTVVNDENETNAVALSEIESTVNCDANKPTYLNATEAASFTMNVESPNRENFHSKIPDIIPVYATVTRENCPHQVLNDEYEDSKRRCMLVCSTDHTSIWWHYIIRTLLYGL